VPGLIRTTLRQRGLIQQRPAEAAASPLSAFIAKLHGFGTPKRSTRLRSVNLPTERRAPHERGVFFRSGWTDPGSTASSPSGCPSVDVSAMESFFSSLKTERIARKVYRTRDEARADVFDYVERFYNTKRRHSTIGYLSPMEFEMKAGFA